MIPSRQHLFPPRADVDPNRGFDDNRVLACNTCVALRRRLRQTLDHSSNPFHSDNLPGFVTVHWLKAGYGRIIQKTRAATGGTHGRHDIDMWLSLLPIESDIEDLICPRRISG